MTHGGSILYCDDCAATTIQYLKPKKSLKSLFWVAPAIYSTNACQLAFRLPRGFSGCFVLSAAIKSQRIKGSKCCGQTDSNEVKQMLACPYHIDTLPSVAIRYILVQILDVEPPGSTSKANIEKNKAGAALSFKSALKNTGKSQNYILPAPYHY